MLDRRSIVVVDAKMGERDEQGVLTQPPTARMVSVKLNSQKGAAGFSATLTCFSSAAELRGLDFSSSKMKIVGKYHSVERGLNLGTKCDR